MVRTARGRAEELLDSLPNKISGSLLFPETMQFLHRAELSFKEHARDQRHLCAEEVLELNKPATADEYTLINRAHSQIMNTKSPGVHPQVRRCF